MDCRFCQSKAVGVNEARKDIPSRSKDGPTTVHCINTWKQMPQSADNSAAGEITAPVVRALAQRKARTRVL